MLYLAIPAHNESATIGVLLWRLRTVLAEFPREYEAVVYDDASTDNTAELLESYARVMPLTVLRGEKPLGYAGAVNALARYVSRQTRYPRRDAMLLLQGDFTDPPALVPEFVKQFEGGADLVVGERTANALKRAPEPVRRMQRATSWMLRLLVRAEGVRDLTSSYRLVRISVLRDLIRNIGDAPVCEGDSQSANADFLLHLVPLARRVATLEVEPTWSVRIRDTRRVAMRDGMALARWAWRARGRRVAASTAPDTAQDLPRSARGPRDRDAVLPFEAVEAPRVSARTPAPAAPPRKARPARNAALPPVPGRPAPLATADDDGDATPIDGDRTRPRRKRTRGGRKDVAALDDSDNPTLSEANAEPRSPSEPRRGRRERGERDGDGVARDTRDPGAQPEVAADSVVAAGTPGPDDKVVEAVPDAAALSPLLNEVVEEAEGSFDAHLSTRPPRKRRRRRGARNRNGAAVEGDAEGGAEGGANDEGEDSTNARAADGDRPTDRAADRDDSSPYSDAEPDAARASRDDGGDSDTPGSEARARRRGRRGRRGGARRGRSNRGDDASGSDGAPDGDSSGPANTPDGDD